MANEVVTFTAKHITKRAAETAVETGFYASKDEFIEDAIETLLSARKDVKADIACELYKKEDISLGKAAEMLGKNIDEMKLEMHGRGIKRRTGDDIKNTKEMADVAIKFAKPKTNKCLVRVCACDEKGEVN